MAGLRLLAGGATVTMWMLVKALLLKDLIGFGISVVVIVVLFLGSLLYIKMKDWRDK